MDRASSLYEKFKDRRWLSVISVKKRSVSVRNLLQVIFRESGLRISCEEEEFYDFSLSVNVENKTIGDIVDGVCAFSWSRVGKDGREYCIFPNFENAVTILAPKTGWRKAMNDAGGEFMLGAERLGADIKKKIESSQGVPVKNLPSGMRESLEDMLEVMNKQVKVEGGQTLAQGDLDNGSISISNSTDHGIDSMMLTINTSSRTTSWLITNADKKMDSLKNKIDSESYTTAKISTEDQNDFISRMKIMVESPAKYLTCPDLLHSLSEGSKMSFISESPELMPQKVRTLVPRQPLGKAMGYLARVYPETEWEVRRSEILIVRGPSNPARDPKQGRKGP